MGYGSRALQQLIAYYEGKLTSPDKIEEPNRDQALVRQIDGDLNSILGRKEKNWKKEEGNRKKHRKENALKTKKRTKF